MAGPGAVGAARGRCGLGAPGAPSGGAEVIDQERKTGGQHTPLTHRIAEVTTGSPAGISFACSTEGVPVVVVPWKADEISEKSVTSKAKVHASMGMRDLTGILVIFKSPSVSAQSDQ